jgi:serine/threonine protein kinase
VAIKLADPHGHAVRWSEGTFQPESELLKRLRGTPAIGSYGVGYLEEEPERLAHVMELARGVELNRLGRDQKPRRRGQVAAILIQVLIALDAAHAIGVRHNDIKPAHVNIVDDDPSSVKLLDWGAASPLNSESRVGWAHFNAPEQWLAHPWNDQLRLLLPEPYRSTQLSTVDDRSGDLYSTGAVGIWMVTCGQTLAERTASRTVLSKLLAVDDRGRKLLGILERAIEHDPSKRSRRATDFIAALRPLAAAAPPSAQ